MHPGLILFFLKKESKKRFEQGLRAQATGGAAPMTPAIF